MNRRTQIVLLVTIPIFFATISSMLLTLNSPSVLWVAAAIMAAVDKTLGGWSILPPALSWAVVAFIVGSLCYFAVFESHKVGQRDLRLSYLILAVAILLFGPFVWAGMDIFLAVP